MRATAVGKWLVRLLLGGPPRPFVGPCGAIEDAGRGAGISRFFRRDRGPIVATARSTLGGQLAYKNKMDSRCRSFGSLRSVSSPDHGLPRPLIGTQDWSSLPGALSLGAGGRGYRLIALDGESNWLEGAMLCGVYVIAALTFFFSP